jgi:DNA-binding beta-propeller fold protein YncE
LAVINAMTNTVMTQVRVGSAPLGVTVSPDGTRVYVTTERSDSISVVDATTNTPLPAIMNPGFFEGIAVRPTPTGLQVWAVDNFFNRVLVIDLVPTSVAPMSITPILVERNPVSFGQFIGGK